MRRAALEQAQLLVEVARRISEPAEALPRGSCPAVMVSLYRDAVSWVIRSELPGVQDRPLSETWEALPHDRLLRAAGDESTLAAVRTLLTHSPERRTRMPAASAALARSFVETLLRETEAPEREVQRLKRQRCMRLGLVASVLAAIAAAAPYVLRGPNLASKRPFEQSSVYQGCGASACSKLLFHTNFESNPWMTIDLGGIEKVSLVEVYNRTDCCAERALPLVIELSTDGRTFAEVARRDAAFLTWQAHFATREARYVRLRSLRTTTLHLEQVIVR